MSSDRKGARSSSRLGIIILGMHRSGTSALTRALNLLGAHLPNDLIGPADSNETGHWEPSAVVSFNEALLASAGSRWDDWRPLSLASVNSSESAEFLGRARTLLRQEYESYPLIVLKDPRICRLSRFWFLAMQSEDIETRALLPIRSPEEVASSLQQRDLIVSGYAHLLWLRYTLDAEHGSRGIIRAFCRYDELLEDWEAVVERMEDRLGIRFPNRCPAVEAEIADFLTVRHRHFSTKFEQEPINDEVHAWASEVFSILCRWSLEGETSEGRRRLDQIRNKFDAASAAFTQIGIVGGPVPGQSGAGLARIRQLEAELETSQRAVVAQADVALRSQSQSAELQLVQWEQSQLFTRARAEAEAERGRREAAEQEQKNLADALDIARGSVKSLQEQLDILLVKYEDVHRRMDLLCEELLASEVRESAAIKEISKLLEQISLFHNVTYESQRLCDQLARERDGALAESEARLGRIDWLLKVNASILAAPAWWYLLPHRLKMHKIEQSLSRQELFDERSYLAIHPDVAASGSNPLEHYLLHGIREGRPQR